jgi:hypothetical protein
MNQPGEPAAAGPDLAHQGGLPVMPAGSAWLACNQAFPARRARQGEFGLMAKGKGPAPPATHQADIREVATTSGRR